MLKKVSILLFSCLLVLLITKLNDANAEEQESLSDEELRILIDEVGHTEEEAKALPVDIARQLMSEDAKVVNSGSVIKEMIEPTNPEKLPKGSISPSTMKLSGTAYKVTSDIKNQDKFYFYGNFEWLKTPAWALTDKMTIGFPSSPGFYLPTSSGSVTQHQHRYSYATTGNNWVDKPVVTTPVSWEPNQGVAGSYDLVAGDATKHKGFIMQYVYVPVANNGSMNVKIEYGHRIISGSVGISVYPAGLGITPSVNTDTASYALTVNY